MRIIIKSLFNYLASVDHDKIPKQSKKMDNKKKEEKQK